MQYEKQISDIVDAIDQIASGIERLKSFGVIRSRKFYEDLAEWLVAQLFDGTLAPSKIQQHWDVKCDGGCVQVRSHWKALDNPNRWSNAGGAYDELVIVVFNQMLRVSELYRVPAAEVAKLRSPDNRLRWDDLAQWRLHPGELAIPTILKPLFP
jgi:hypothetical protein